MAGEWPETTICGTQRATRPRDGAIARLADAQHGVVSLSQLLDHELSASAVRSRVTAGRLHKVHRSVYAVGRATLTREGRWMAAVLACGEGALLSHRSAGALWGLRSSSRQLTEVTTPSRSGRTRAGIEVHSGAGIAPQDVAAEEGVPCTSVVRTLLDLAGCLSPVALERAVQRAETLRLYDGLAMEELVKRAGKKRGVAVLRTVLTEGDFTGPGTKSVLEERFFDLCSTYRIPRPQVNSFVEGFEVDFVWRDQRLVLETDSRAFHSHCRDVVRDHARDQRLDTAGWRIRRATFNQVTYEPAALAERLRGWLVGGA